MDRPDGGRSGIHYGDESAVAYRQGSVEVLSIIVFVRKTYQYYFCYYMRTFHGYFRDDMKKTFQVSFVCATSQYASAVADIAVIAVVPLVPDVLTLTGVSIIAGVPGVVGVLAVASIRVDPGSPILARFIAYCYVLREGLSDYRTTAIVSYFLAIGLSEYRILQWQILETVGYRI
jgi:hypothetical protein